MVCLCYAYANFRGTMLLCLIHYVLLQVFGPLNFRTKKNPNQIQCLQLFCCFKQNARLRFGIISLAHAPVNMTDFSIGSINCVRHFPQT